ncbi:heat shock protein 83 [Dorcoceras hygrometricum]|uniref:Heat shock protein 83 n=1 Tax=Dorcoceras hygrometricum TaxID=472368 RepID=A0A2Z7C2D6_9LAMI|nr:heat shock protein 83 [Dorcoceras hygrometricum]
MTIKRSEAEADTLKQLVIESRKAINTLQEVLLAMIESLGKDVESDASLKWGKLPVDQHIEKDLLLLLLLIMSYTAKEGCRIPHLLGRKEDVPGPTHRPAQIQQINRKAVVSTSNNRGMGDRAGVERGGGNRFKERKIQSHQEYLVRKVVIEQSWGGHKVTKDGEQLGKETKITFFLKEDPLEYLEERNTKDLVKKHSEFISYPIYLWTGKTTEKEFGDEEDDEIEKEDQLEFKAIYYITGESKKVGENYPSLERLKKKDSFRPSASKNQATRGDCFLWYNDGIEQVTESTRLHYTDELNRTFTVSEWKRVENGESVVEWRMLVVYRKTWDSSAA